MPLMMPGKPGGPAYGQLPALMWRQPLIVPGQSTNMRLTSEEDLCAMDEAVMGTNQLLLLPTPGFSRVRDPRLAELGAASVGVIGQIVTRWRHPDHSCTVRFWIFARALVIRLGDLQPCLFAEHRRWYDPVAWTPETASLASDVRNLAQRYLAIEGQKPPFKPLEETPGTVADWAAACVPWFGTNRALFALDPKERLEIVGAYLETLLSELEPEPPPPRSTIGQPAWWSFVDGSGQPG